MSSLHAQKAHKLSSTCCCRDMGKGGIVSHLPGMAVPLCDSQDIAIPFEKSPFD